MDRSAPSSTAPPTPTLDVDGTSRSQVKAAIHKPVQKRVGHPAGARPASKDLLACHEGVDWERTSVWRFDGKAHQMRCLMDSCPHPSRMFKSLYTLRTHMRTKHQRSVTSADAERIQAEAFDGVAKRGVDYGPSRDSSLRNSSGTRVLECLVPGCVHPTRLFNQSVNLRAHLWRAHRLVLPKLKLT